MIEPLEPGLYREIVGRALDEDIGAGDVTTAATVSPSQRAKGVFLVKSDCVVAGLDVAFEAFRQAAKKGTGVFSDIGPARRLSEEHPSEKTPVPFFTAHRQDGDWCRAGEEIAEVAGSAVALLTAERTALNFLQRLSGIATHARKFVDAADGRITVLDTRKTTPTLRVLEKYAVRAGGAVNHRTGLYDAVLIKDNHIRLAGGVKAAVDRTRRYRPAMPIEVEAQSLAQVDEALAAGADTILLDNLSLEEIREAVARTHGRALTEVSGGVTLERMADLAATGAGFVSVGALTHSAPAIDISFELEPISVDDHASAPLPPDLAEALVSARSRLGRLGASITYFPAIGSTNDAAATLARHSAHDGAVVIADTQTAGRGRRGREWFSPPGGGLYVSVVLRPGRSLGGGGDRATRLLTLAAGVALVEAIETAAGLAVDLKWPNDLYIARRKLAGILAEVVLGPEEPIVLGYGVNVRPAAYPPELGDRATSLESELGRDVDRALVFVESLASLARRYDDLLEGRFDAILDAWRARAPGSRGARVALTTGATASGVESGVTAGIDDEGALLVLVGDRIERIVAGEVTWL